MKLRLLSLLLALAPFPGQALDLTPTMAFRDLEGIKIPIILFTDAGQKISYQPPVKWNVSGGEGVLSLYPPELPDAVLQLVVRPRKPLDPGATEDLEKWCLAQLPQDATDPKREGEAANNIFTLGTLPSREFTFSYAAQGRRFTTSVAIVDWNERERLAVIVTARTADHRPIYETAMRSMFSWSPQ